MSRNKDAKAPRRNKMPAYQASLRRRLKVANARIERFTGWRLIQERAKRARLVRLLDGSY